MEVSILPVDKEWIETLRSPSCYLKTVHSDEHVIPFINAVLTPRNHSALVFASKKEGLHPSGMMWKAASVKQILY